MFKKLKENKDTIAYIFSHVAGYAAADLITDMLTVYIDSRGFGTGNKLLKTFGKLTLTTIIANDIERKTISQLCEIFGLDPEIFGLVDPHSGKRIYY